MAKMKMPGKMNPMAGLEEDGMGPIGPMGPSGPKVTVAPRMPSPKMPAPKGIKGTGAFKTLMQTLKGRS